jgi:hypothetical protein
MTTDIDYAKKELLKGKAFVVVKSGKVIAESDEKGVFPLFSAVTKLNLENASLADKIVGKAVAFLSVYSGIASVYAVVASESAVGVLTNYSIGIEAETVVPMIMNRTGDDQCPIEKLVDCCTPEKAYTVLKKKFGG